MLHSTFSELRSGVFLSSAWSRTVLERHLLCSRASLGAGRGCSSECRPVMDACQLLGQLSLLGSGCHGRLPHWWAGRRSHSYGVSKSVLCLATHRSGVVLLTVLVVSKIISYSVAEETRCLLEYNAVFNFYACSEQSASSLTGVGMYGIKQNWSSKKEEMQECAWWL